MDEHSVRVVSVVDDDASLRRAVRNLLTSMGFRVETFASAEAFLECTDQDKTGCLVVDLRMEGMDGLALLTHLTLAGTPIPTIILTAHGDDELRTKRCRQGPSRSLPSPFTPMCCWTL